MASIVVLSNTIPDILQYDVVFFLKFRFKNVC